MCSRGQFVASHPRGSERDTTSLAEHYTLDNKVLGQGGCGYVVRAQCRKTGCTRAVKVLSKVKNSREIAGVNFEVNMLKLLDHPNIIKLFETFEDAENVYLVLEFCVGGEVLDHISRGRPLTEANIAVVMQQVLRAVRYMHRIHVRHGDLVPANVLFHTRDPAGENIVKIADFGPVRGGQPALDDIQACAVVFRTVLSYTGKPRNLNESTPLEPNTRRVFNTDGVELEVSGLAKDLLMKLQDSRPSCLYSAGQALGHPWFERSLPTPAKVKMPPTFWQSVEQFRAHSLLKKASLYIIADRCPHQQMMQELRRAFSHVDFDQDGFVSPREMERALRKSHLSVPSDIAALLKDVDPDGVGVLDFTTFVAIYLCTKAYYKSDAACQLAFQHFDRNLDGQISCDELESFLADADAPNAVSRVDIPELVRTVDQNRDGKISLSEFTAMMNTQPGKGGTGACEASTTAGSTVSTPRAMTPRKSETRRRIMVQKMAILEAGIQKRLTREKDKEEKEEKKQRRKEKKEKKKKKKEKDQQKKRRVVCASSIGGIAGNDVAILDDLIDSPSDLLALGRQDALPDPRGEGDASDGSDSADTADDALESRSVSSHCSESSQGDDPPAEVCPSFGVGQLSALSVPLRPPVPPQSDEVPRGAPVRASQVVARSSVQSTEVTVSKFIFLDVDGVLHAAHHAVQPFVPDCMDALARIVQCTGARIVLSSAWRLHGPTGRRAVDKALQKYGISKTFSQTPSEDSLSSRPDEIRTWLSRNTDRSMIVRWVVLDDMDMNYALSEHLIHTDEVLGLQEIDADLAISILNDEPLCDDESEYESSDDSATSPQ